MPSSHDTPRSTNHSNQSRSLPKQREGILKSARSSHIYSFVYLDTGGMCAHMRLFGRFRFVFSFPFRHTVLPRHTISQRQRKQNALQATQKSESVGPIFINKLERRTKIIIRINFVCINTWCVSCVNVLNRIDIAKHGH